VLLAEGCVSTDAQPDLGLIRFEAFHLLVHFDPEVLQDWLNVSARWGLTYFPPASHQWIPTQC